MPLVSYYPIKNYRCCTGVYFQLWGQLSLTAPHMLRVTMARDLIHLQMSDLQVKLDLYAERLIYREKDCLYAERNGYIS